MKVNHNMSAVLTNKQLLRTENKVTEAMERLSSGLKINHSKDNPAGMAISNKLNLQIEGLDQASQNASDGISVLQTTDGALNEVTSLIQRMRELSVQAASDSNTPDDKKAIQQEVEELKKEISKAVSLIFLRKRGKYEIFKRMYSLYCDYFNCSFDSYFYCDTGFCQWY